MQKRLIIVGALTAMLIGLGMLGWVGYNVFVEVQPGFRFVSYGQFMAPLLLAAVGGYWLHRGLHWDDGCNVEEPDSSHSSMK